MADKILVGPTGNNYEIVKKQIDGKIFNLHSCVFNKQDYFLKIAKSKDLNHVLEKEEFTLNILKEQSEALEAEYAMNPKNTQKLKYNYMFPEVIDFFESKDEGDRAVMVLSFSNISEKRSDLSPLSFILERDKVVIDPRTSAWILGKLLKLLTFTQSINVAINNIYLKNILINKKEHYVALSDWSKARFVSPMLSPFARTNEIVQMTKAVVRVLGGNPRTGEIPSDDQLQDDRYQNMIKSLIQGDYENAFDAHKDFYQLVYSLWDPDPITGTRFHNYTTKILN